MFILSSIKTFYVNKYKIEIKNRPVFVLFSSSTVYDLSNCCVTFVPHCINVLNQILKAIPITMLLSYCSKIF
jgi:hypothetical protein